MNLYSIPTYLTSFLVTSLAILILIKSKTNFANKYFSIICFSTAVWLFFSSIAYNSEEMAEFYMRLCYVGIVFLPISIFQFTIHFLELGAHQKYTKLFMLIGIIFIINIFYTDHVISGVNKFFWGYYPKAGKFHPIFLLFFMIVTSFCFFLLVWKYLSIKTTRIKKNQIKYILIAFLFFNFAAIDFIANYGIQLYPIGYLPVTFFLSIIAYSIIKYRLLDISIVVTRTGIFIAVYSVILGIPYVLTFLLRNYLEVLLGKNWWFVPMAMLTVLATVGPFIYLYIQKRAEEQLLKDQRRYQATLSQASAGMGRIKDLNRLLELIVYIVTRAVRLEHTSVYIFDQSKNKYRIGAYKGAASSQASIELIPDSVLVQHIVKTKIPVVYEEIKQRVQDYNDQHLAKVEATLKQMDAALVVPSLIEDRLLAILVMGKKKSGKLFGEDDLSVFSILANQAALAIENAQFYEDVKTTQEQLFQAEKMATIGTMADGLSHQINNRLHALGFIAGDALDTIKMKRDIQMSDEMKGVMSDLERSLVRIQENVLQGGEVVQGLLRYTRKGEQGYAPVEVDKLVTAALEMAQFKIKTHEMKILREYAKDGPKIKGNFTQLQEVFFNMIDNAYDAMMQRKNEHKEPGFQPTLRIQTHVANDRIFVKFTDNGIGVKPEDYAKIFTPFFTTKLSSKKGTGLGLYVIKKIVEDNHKGKVTFDSQYLKGTTMTLNLPIAF